MGRCYTIRVPLNLAGHDDANAVQLLQAAMAKAHAAPPGSADPSLSRPVEQPGGEATAYLEVAAASKMELEASIETVLATIGQHGMVGTGPLTILAVRTDE